MRVLIASVAMLLVSLGAANATQADWPITSAIEFAGADGPAIVRITVSEAATDINIQVYGVDGMRVGQSNIAQRRRGQLAAGASFTFPVTIHPGPGRSFVVVSAHAHFAHMGEGGNVRSFPFGAESAAQQSEHTRCVRQDPDGVWIRDPDCDPSASAQPDDPPLLTIAELKRAPPVGRIVRVAGFVVDSYFCPPCPDGAECKPCDGASMLYVAATPNRDTSSPADVLTITTPDPSRYQRGAHYRFEIEVRDRSEGWGDARLVRSQGPDPN